MNESAYNQKKNAHLYLGGRSEAIQQANLESIDVHTQYDYTKSTLHQHEAVFQK